MMIDQEMKQIETEPRSSKHLYMPSYNSTINLYSCVIHNQFGQTKLLERAKTNERMERARPETTYKAFVIPLVVDPTYSSQPEIEGQFGRRWAQ